MEIFDNKPDEKPKCKRSEAFGDPPDDFETKSVVSSTECTGLAQSAILNEDEAQSYGDIYDIPLSKPDSKKTKSDKIK